MKKLIPLFAFISAVGFGNAQVPTVYITRGANPICEGQSATLVAGGATTYSWCDGLGTLNTVIVSPTVTTTYTVTGTTTGGTNTASVTVNVVNPTLITTAMPNPISTGSSTTLTASMISPGCCDSSGGMNYNWSLGSIGNTVTVSPMATTTYTVTATDCGCSSTADITVYVSPTTVIITAVAIPNPVCAGTTTTLTAGGGTSYSWCCGLGTSNSITVSPTVTTTYTVTGTTTGGTNTASITVNIDNPAIIISATSNPISTGSSSTLTAYGGATYSWCCGLGTANPVTVSPITTTTYTVTGADCNGCSNTANITISVNTGIKTMDVSNAISVYPNPVTQEIQVISNQCSVNSIEIYDLFGEKIYASPITDYCSPASQAKRGEPITINCGSFAKGVYFIKATTSEGAVVKKFIKE
jgi:hypothetical protein